MTLFSFLSEKPRRVSRLAATIVCIKARKVFLLFTGKITSVKEAWPPVWGHGVVHESAGLEMKGKKKQNVN